MMPLILSRPRENYLSLAFRITFLEYFIVFPTYLPTGEQNSRGAPGSRATNVREKKLAYILVVHFYFVPFYRYCPPPRPPFLFLLSLYDFSSSSSSPIYY